jgi:ABC-type branched-subunit amino acid transport system ATPase component/ABC-type branched-subunit amino acid transport system permease subunit
MSTAGLVAGGTPFLVAVGYGTVIGVAGAVLVGFPALRVRGLFLAVATLAFAVAARSWILEREIFTGGEAFVSVPRPTVLGIDLTPQNRYYYLCLAVLVLAAVLITGLRRSGIGRTIIAVRDNEDAAASFTVAPAVAKLIAFGVSGGLAALAGGLLAGLRVQFGAEAFDPNESLLVVAMTVIGGLGSVAGALLGALYVVGLPALFGETPQVALATSSIGLLLLLLYFPGGLVQLLYKAREALLRRATPADPPAVLPTQRRPAAVVEPTETQPLPEGTPVLEARDVTVRFGGREALRSVSLEAGDGEVIGLIGSNGAGKSTLMNVITGYLGPTQGAVLLRGQDVSALSAHERARLGMGRVFQDARLFSDLTVRETVQVALEARQRSELVPSLLGLPPARRAERWMRAEADSYVDFLGLGRYADSYVGSLSTGTRRIVELTCLVSQGSSLLLLDEPTAGVAQRETEKFGPLILSIRQQLSATVVIIEHDIPLIMSMSDRVYCFAAGECIAQGLPEDVRHDPAVVAAYLGTDERAINRSGDAAAGQPTPDEQATRARNRRRASAPRRRRTSASLRRWR